MQRFLQYMPGLLCIIILTSCQLNTSGNGMVKRRAGNSIPVLVYQTYGLPEPIYDSAQQQGFRKYGVEVKSVTGCLVTDSLLQSIERNNKAVYSHLDKRFGLNAEQRIKEEIREEVKEKNNGN